MLTKLSETDIATQLASVPDWQRSDNAITRTVQCASYPAASALLVQLAFAAERLDHHPDVYWSYRTITLRLSTHDVEGLSLLDFQLAKTFDALFLVA